MGEKERGITALRETFTGWETFLARISEDQILTANAAGYSIKETVAHLRAWQQVSIARMEAAVQSSVPAYPDWLDGLSPEDDEHLDEFNARIYQAFHDLTWPVLYQAWKAGFTRLIGLAEALPAKDLLEPGRYDWLGLYPLVGVLEGSRGHHAEHLEGCLAFYPPDGKA